MKVVVVFLLIVLGCTTGDCRSLDQEGHATPPPPLPPTTTTLGPPQRPGCHYDGKFFEPDTEIDHHNNDGVCYYLYCTAEGEIEEIKCPTPPPPTTIIGDPLPPGCFYENNYYEPDNEIGFKNSDGACYYVYCTSKGEIEEIKCPTPPLPPTTTTLGPPMPSGCLYENNYYEPDTEIGYKNTDGTCYYVYCTSKGEIEEIKCPTPPLPPTTTTLGPPMPPGCFYENNYYEPDTEIGFKNTDGTCYYVYCTAEGQIDKNKCPTTTTTLGPPMPPDCFYEENYYAPGTQTKINDFTWVICTDDGELLVAMA